MLPAAHCQSRLLEVCPWRPLLPQKAQQLKVHAAAPQLQHATPRSGLGLQHSPAPERLQAESRPRRSKEDQRHLTLLLKCLSCPAGSPADEAAHHKSPEPQKDQHTWKRVASKRHDIVTHVQPAPCGALSSFTQCQQRQLALMHHLAPLFDVRRSSRKPCERASGAGLPEVFFTLSKKCCTAACRRKLESQA